MPKSIDRSLEEPVPDEVLGRLADLAQVPSEERESFFGSVGEATEIAWKRYGILTTAATMGNVHRAHAAASRLYTDLRNLKKNERESAE